SRGTLCVRAPFHGDRPGALRHRRNGRARGAVRRARPRLAPRPRRVAHLCPGRSGARAPRGARRRMPARARAARAAQGMRRQGRRAGRAVTAKREIRSAKLRAPSGHFSQAIEVEAKGRIVFLSGMTARRADGTIAGVGDIEAQTRQVCENLKSAVEAAGGSLDDVCRVDVYVRNMDHFEAIHKVRREYFHAPAPASTMVEVTKMVHPDYLLDINAIAVLQYSVRKPEL